MGFIIRQTPLFLGELEKVTDQSNGVYTSNLLYSKLVTTNVFRNICSYSEKKLVKIHSSKGFIYPRDINLF